MIGNAFLLMKLENDIISEVDFLAKAFLEMFKIQFFYLYFRKHLENFRNSRTISGFGPSERKITAGFLNFLEQWSKLMRFRIFLKIGGKLPKKYTASGAVGSAPVLHRGRPT